MIVCFTAALAQMNNKQIYCDLICAVCVLRLEAVTRSGMLIMSKFMLNINQ